MKITAILKNMRYPLPKDFDPLTTRIGSIARKMKAEVSEPVLCHNDFYGPNFLVRGNEMRLIDWEYAAMGDPACDIGNFVAQGSGYTVEQTLDLLESNGNGEETLPRSRRAGRLVLVCMGHV